MKTDEREQARCLRREEGRSIREIANLLGVSRSSVSVWVRDVHLTSAQQESLRLRNPAYNVRLNGNATRAARSRAERHRHQRMGRALARRGDPFHAAGCMLYWAEGDKGGHRAALSNSDPEVLRFFVAFLRRYFRVPNERIRVWCNLFADHVERQREIEDFWLELVELPTSCLTKSTVNTYSRHSKRKRTNVLPYGTCRVAVYDTGIVQSIFGAIQEYGGFERPEWLR